MGESEKISLDLSGADSSSEGFSKNERLILINSLLVKLYHSTRDYSKILRLLKESESLGKSLISQTQQKKWKQFLINLYSQMGEVNFTLSRIENAIEAYQNSFEMASQYRSEVTKAKVASLDELRAAISLVNLLTISKDLDSKFSIKKDFLPRILEVYKFAFGDEPIPAYWSDHHQKLGYALRSLDLVHRKLGLQAIFDEKDAIDSKLSDPVVSIYGAKEVSKREALAESYSLLLNDVNLSWKILFLRGQTERAFRELIALKYNPEVAPEFSPQDRLLIKIVSQSYLEMSLAKLGAKSDSEDYIKMLLEIEGLDSQCNKIFCQKSDVTLDGLEALSRQLDIDEVLALVFSDGSGGEFGLVVDNVSGLRIFTSKDNSQLVQSREEDFFSYPGDFKNYSRIYLRSVGYSKPLDSGFSEKNGFSNVANILGLDWLRKKLESKEKICSAVGEELLEVNDKLFISTLNPFDSFFEGDFPESSHFLERLKSKANSCLRHLKINLVERPLALIDTNLDDEWVSILFANFNLTSLSFNTLSSEGSSNKISYVYGIPIKKVADASRVKRDLQSRIQKSRTGDHEILGKLYRELAYLEESLGDDAAKSHFRESFLHYQNAGHAGKNLDLYLKSRDKSWSARDFLLAGQLALDNQQPEVILLLSSDFSAAANWGEKDEWRRLGLKAARALQHPPEEVFQIEEGINHCNSGLAGDRIKKCQIFWQLEKLDFLVNRKRSLLEASVLIPELDSSGFTSDQETRFFFLSIDIFWGLGDFLNARRVLAKLVDRLADLPTVNRWEVFERALELESTTGDLVRFEDWILLADKHLGFGKKEGFWQRIHKAFRSHFFLDVDREIDFRTFMHEEVDPSYSVHVNRIRALLAHLCGRIDLAQISLKNSLSNLNQPRDWREFIDSKRLLELQGKQALSLNLGKDDWRERTLLGLADLREGKIDSAKGHWGAAIDLLQKAQLGAASKGLRPSSQPELGDLLSLTMRLDGLSADERISTAQLLREREIYDDQLWNAQVFAIDPPSLMGSAPLPGEGIVLFWAQNKFGGILAKHGAEEFSLLFDDREGGVLDLLYSYQKALQSGEYLEQLEEKLFKAWLQPVLEKFGREKTMKMMFFGDIPDFSTLASYLLPDYKRPQPVLSFRSQVNEVSPPFCQISDHRRAEHSRTRFFTATKLSFESRLLDKQNRLKSSCSTRESSEIMAIDERTPFSLETSDQNKIIYFDSALADRNLLRRHINRWAGKTRGQVFSRSPKDLGILPERSIYDMALGDQKIKFTQNRSHVGLEVLSNL